MAATVLIVDDERALRQSLQSVLTEEGYTAVSAATAAEALRQADTLAPDVVLCDIQLPDRSGLEVLAELRDRHPQVRVMMITAYATLENAIQALQRGASDYLVKPFLFDDLLHRIRRLIEERSLERETRRLRHSLRDAGARSKLVGSSPPMQGLQRLIRRIASTSSTALITGESGTGKELVARSIHAQSAHARGPFLAVNCGAMPETLLESELFGYRKGAFSGADRHKEGLLQLAEGGTLFLDEIGDLPLPLQPKLLRVLESKEFIPLGGTAVVRVSTRILAASNRDLERMVDEGSFREDLYYRLNMFEIRVPPLRERIEDLPELVDHLIERCNRDLGRDIRGVEPEALARLRAQPWRGNVRELENVVQRAILLAEGPVLRQQDLFPDCPPAARPLRTLRDEVRDFERRVIEGAVRQHGGDKRRAAADLGISLATLYAKLQVRPAASRFPESARAGFQETGKPKPGDHRNSL